MTTAVVKNAPKAGLDYCPICNGKLANFAGFRKNSEGQFIDRHHKPVKDPVRLYWIACQACQTPVPPDHPYQVELDRDMAAAEAKAAEEGKRAASPVSTSGLVYGDSAELASKEYARLLERVAHLETEVTMLKTAIQTARKR